MSPLHPFTPSRRRDLLALLLLAALTLAFFWKLAFSNLIIARGDIFTYFTPYRDFAAQAMREGRIPLWNPYLFMGAPFLANSQAGVFYPLNWPLSWLETARAINWTIVLHVFIAASGVYAFARSRLSLSIGAAFLAALSFGLGGYLGTQIEHVNQLQGLAWLGWLFLVYDWVIRDQGSGIRRGLLLAVVISLQLLAGHTQTVFISLISLGVYALWQMFEAWRGTKHSYVLLITRYLLPVALAAIFAIALSAVQLLPTLELTRESARSGGLPMNLAVSFSLDPRLIGRALLPDYAGAMPEGGEFTAFFSVTALVLMVIGGLVTGQSVNRTIKRALVVVAGVGVLLALGGYNPIYYLLLKVPGFDLFRAPARWIVLLVFAGSLLAGVGLDALRESIKRRWLIAPSLVIAALIASTFMSTSLVPAGASGPLGPPDVLSLLLWLVPLVMLVAFVSLVTRHSSLVILLACLELFFATRALPYNSRPTAPDALTNLRPAITALQVGAQDHLPPDRFLSISKIQFDPGDTAELKSIYGDQLSEKAFYDLIVATKAKEVIAPNLSMFYRLPSVDGYDGGVLPLRNYIAFQQLLLDPGLIQTDGRLREQLKSIPDARWLSLMNARFILTDKVGDQWYDGVLYDLQFATRLEAGQSAATDQLPSFKGDALGIVYSDAASTGTLAQIEITFEDGSTQMRPLIDQPLEVKGSLSATRVAWVERRGVKAIRITGDAGVTLRGLALIDQSSGAFQPFVLAPQGRFRVAYSGDVKIYENVAVLPRAFCVGAAHVVANDDEAIAYMQRAEFDPAGEIVIGDRGSGIGDQAVLLDHLVIPSSCHLVAYEPEHITIETNVTQDSYLVLTDAYYPGWLATVDGQPAPIERADVLFRAVKVPAGAHQIEFRYEPQSFAIGAAISIGAWVMLLAAAVITGVRSRRRVL
ncbi:MAG: YfhO family protein [Chloroflexi bacterium]|nr:YfhO family protein [Chloroflexota bacterium]